MVFISIESDEAFGRKSAESERTARHLLGLPSSQGNFKLNASPDRVGAKRI